MNTMINNADVDVEEEVYEGNEEIMEPSETEYEFEEKATELVSEDEDIMDDKTHESVEQSNKEPEAITLPEGVTPEPRNDEEMHIKHVATSQAAVDAYLKVSDDQGALLGDGALLKKIKILCKTYGKDRIKKIRKPDKALKEFKELTTRYAQQVNFTENKAGGIITHYRIWLGMLLNIQKEIVMKTDRKWIPWFNQNYNPSLLRSAEDYMNLARIPGIIKYSVFGKERLLDIARVIGKSDSSDPVNDFLEKNNIVFNPLLETDNDWWKRETDIAINHQRLIDAGLDQIPKDKVASFVQKGKEIKPSHIKVLKEVKSLNGNVIECMDQIIASNGKLEPIITPQRKAEGFLNKTQNFIKTVESAIQDSEYRSKIKPEMYATLKEKILALEPFVMSNAEDEGDLSDDVEIMTTGPDLLILNNFNQ
jgi:hypothetical protein